MSVVKTLLVNRGNDPCNKAICKSVFFFGNKKATMVFDFFLCRKKSVFFPYSTNKLGKRPVTRNRVLYKTSQKHNQI